MAKKILLAFLDLETTGFDPEKHEILEIGGLLVNQNQDDNGKITYEEVGEFEYKIKPTHLETADSEALRINRYNEADWLFAADLPQVLKALVQKTDGATMVAHNLSFDWSFLVKAFSENKIENKMSYHRLDTLSIAFAKLSTKNNAPNLNLWALAEYFGLQNEKAHTALADVRVTYEIYKKLMAL